MIDTNAFKGKVSNCFLIYNNMLFIKIKLANISA